MIIRATKYHRVKLAGKGKPTDGVKLSGDRCQRLQVDDASGEGLYISIQDAEGAKQKLISQAKGRISIANCECVRVCCGVFGFMGVLRE